MAKDRKVAVVTGGAKGIGADIAKRLASEGYAVAVLDIDSTAGKQVEAAINEVSKGLFVEYDVTDFAGAADAMKKAADTLGGIDAFVANAGIEENMVTENVTEEIWDKVMDVNIKGAFFSIQAAIPYLKDAENGGKVVNIADIRHRIATGDFAVYAASKAMMVAMTRELATDLWRYGIRCNTVSPGTVLTDMTRKHLEEPGWLELQKSCTLSEELVEPEDISEVVSFLLSDDSFCVNAFDMVVDGGMNFFREKPESSCLD